MAKALTELGGEGEVSRDSGTVSTVPLRWRRAIGDGAPPSSSMMASSKSRIRILDCGCSVGDVADSRSRRSPYWDWNVPRRGRSSRCSCSGAEPRWSSSSGTGVEYPEPVVWMSSWSDIMVAGASSDLASCSFLSCSFESCSLTSSQYSLSVSSSSISLQPLKDRAPVIRGEFPSSFGRRQRCRLQCVAAAGNMPPAIDNVQALPAKAE